MFRALIIILLAIFVLMTMGTILLEQFPGLTPVFEEIKSLGATLWDWSMVKYGPLPTIILAVGVVAVIGTSRRM